MKLSVRNVALAALVVAFGLIVGCESVGLRSMRIYMQQQNWARALEQGKVAVAENPQDAAAWFAIAQVCSQIDSTELLLTAVDRASSITNKHDQGITELRQYVYNDRFNRGVEAYNASNLTLAKEHMRWAIAVDTTRPNAYKVMGMVLRLEHNLPEAATMFGRAWRADTSDIAIGLNYAYMMSAQEHRDEAIEVYSQIHEHHPDNCDATLGYVQTLKDAGQLDRALEVSDAALAEGQPCALNPQLHMRVGIIHMERARQMEDDTAAADNQLSLAAERFHFAADSGNVDAAFNMGICLQQLDRLEEAIGPMERVVAQNPDDYTARIKLAEFLIQLERGDDAERHLNLIKDGIGTPTTPADRQTLSRTHRYLQIIYTVRGNNLGVQAQRLREEARNTRNRAQRRAKEAQAEEIEAQVRTILEQAQQHRELADSFAQ